LTSKFPVAVTPKVKSSVDSKIPVAVTPKVVDVKSPLLLHRNSKNT